MRRIKIKKLLFVTMTLICIAALTIMNKHHINMMELQFANSYKSFETAWQGNDNTFGNLLLVNSIDFIFILSYTILMILSLNHLIKDVIEKHVKKWMIFICLLPGIFDVMENLMMNSFVKDPGNGLKEYYKLYVVFVNTKWLIAIPLSVMIMLAGVSYIIEYLNRKRFQEVV